MSNLNRRSFLSLSAAAAGASMLAACGGGSGDAPAGGGADTSVDPADLTLPLAETATITGLTNYPVGSEPEPGMVSDMQSTAQRAQLAELLKYATIIISSLPLLAMYPFFQRYFDSGIMAGAVKG